jgi:hypothetical protein
MMLNKTLREVWAKCNAGTRIRIIGFMQLRNRENYRFQASSAPDQGSAAVAPNTTFLEAHKLLKTH